MVKATNGMSLRSMTPPEQAHIVNGFTFELSKVMAIRTRVVGQLDIIDTLLGNNVADRMLARAPTTLGGRRIGALVADGFDVDVVSKLRVAAEEAGAMFELVAPYARMTRASDGTTVIADHVIQSGPSVIFEAVVVVASAASVRMLLASPSALDWVSDAFVHCKVLGTIGAARPLLEAVHVTTDEGVIDLAGNGVTAFIEAAKRGRIWARTGGEL